MDPDEKIQLIWKEQEIGILDNPMPDMWYLEGPWISNNTEAAIAFKILAQELNPKQTFAHLDKGIEIFLKFEDGFLLRAIVISLTSENSLSVRRMYNYKEKSTSDGAIITNNFEPNKAGFLRKIYSSIISFFQPGN